MKWCIEQLRTAFPSSAIGVIIPPPSSNQGTSLDEKANAMIEVCEKMNVPYADMRNYISTSDLSDGTHLNTGGSKKYGCAEAKLILDICPYGEPLQQSAIEGQCITTSNTNTYRQNVNESRL